jgi:hypothetical protein
MRSVWVSLMLAAAAGFSQRALAAERRFVWVGPDCANRASLLEQRLSELVEPRDRQRLAGSVAVTRSAAGYTVEVTIELDLHPLGARRFDAESCERAAETAAVAASLAVFDGQGEPKGAVESGIRPDLWTRQPEPQPDFSRPKPRATPPTERLIEPRLGLLGSAELGALPEPAWGAALALELGVGRRWAFALLGRFTSEQQRRLREQQSVLLRSLAGTARGCVSPLPEARYRLDACAGAKLVEVRGRGQGFDVDHSAALAWAAPLLGLNLSVRAPSALEWRCELEGSVPLSRRRFLVDGSEVSRPAALVTELRLGALVRF